MWEGQGDVKEGGRQRSQGSRERPGHGEVREGSRWRGEGSRDRDGDVLEGGTGR